MNSIAILDFGSQYAQIIARRVRESNVYCELFAWDSPKEKILSINPKGFILSGGPKSVYEENAPFIQQFIFDTGLPILGICYGMQALTHALGGKVNPSSEREYGFAEISSLVASSLVASSLVAGSLVASLSQVWMSHGDKVTELPKDFISLAKSENSPYAAMGNLEKKYFGVQFHPEVHHTKNGIELIKHFAVDICDVKPEWTPNSIIDESVQKIREQVGDNKVLAAVSGGVDSSVATALVHKAVGEQLICMFVDTGLLRHNESLEVATAFRDGLGAELITVDASQEFLSALKNVADPEQKRKIVGEKFIRIFEREAKRLGSDIKFLVQGTIYPDVVESSSSSKSKSEKIKTHHNVGGLPEDMSFELVEPLRMLFKDEVRLVGDSLGLNENLVWRQPFPGPGLTVRCLGEITPERVSRLRAADKIFQEELSNAGFLGKHGKVSQAFVVLLPVKSVGVMGDQRTYQEAAAIRAVTTDDFMTADWARLPHELLAKVSGRIVNEVEGINRVVYDITSKPPATIEWE
jgi:GMP synthase (glutamine-hydrolysing)